MKNVEVLHTCVLLFDFNFAKFCLHFSLIVLNLKLYAVQCSVVWCSLAYCSVEQSRVG